MNDDDFDDDDDEDYDDDEDNDSDDDTDDDSDGDSDGDSDDDSDDSDEDDDEDNNDSDGDSSSSSGPLEKGASMDVKDLLQFSCSFADVPRRNSQLPGDEESVVLSDDEEDAEGYSRRVLMNTRIAELSKLKM
jgi:hypothetical protein